LAPTPRYGRGSDLEVILEVIGSADRLPLKPKTQNPKPKTQNPKPKTYTLNP